MVKYFWVLILVGFNLNAQVSEDVILKSKSLRNLIQSIETNEGIICSNDFKYKGTLDTNENKHIINYSCQDIEGLGKEYQINVVVIEDKKDYSIFKYEILDSKMNY